MLHVLLRFTNSDYPFRNYCILVRLNICICINKPMCVKHVYTCKKYEENKKHNNNLEILFKFSLGYLMIIVAHALYESKGSLLVLMNELRNSYYDNVGLLVSGLAQVIWEMLDNYRRLINIVKLCRESFLVLQHFRLPIIRTFIFQNGTY